MRETHVLPHEGYGYNFIPAGFLPPGKDEYWLRNEQFAALFPEKAEGKTEAGGAWRKLNLDEIVKLTKNGNYSSDWNDVLVTDPFDPKLVRNSSFFGLVRLGALQDKLLKHHDFCIPTGIQNSTIISCDIGDNVAILDCTYVSHYIIGDECVLSRIDELQTTNHAKFGNGILMEGEKEDIRVWIDVMNEAGGRSILPFEDMIAADAFLWAAYRDDTAMTEKLKQITQERYGGSYGRYGTIGSGSVVKSCAIIKDAAMGPYTYIKGANKLKNVTILSSAEEPAQIGEGVELVNGIVGYDCHIFYGSKAVRFVMGRNCNLKYGARLIHSVLGDNSTVSCCEILNNLIFPVHEQHHNNSFLIASLVQGLSNLAAAVSIGSNHNSRANDGEIRAKRGFWPGLAATLKHSSCFASYTLIAKGDYPSELNIPLPFSLVSNNVHQNRLEVMPAYFWMYNLYALERNFWKARIRDRRKIKVQHFEPDYLAPDTAEEIIAAIALLELWLGESGFTEGNTDIIGKDLDIRTVSSHQMERSKRSQVIIKPLEALAAYRQMLRWYAVKTIAFFLEERPELDYNGLASLIKSNAPAQRHSDWVNAGGQIVPAFRVDELRQRIGSGEVKSWDEIHRAYAGWLEAYTMDRLCHAWAVLSGLQDKSAPSSPADSAETLKQELAESITLRRWISGQVFDTRAKDYNNPFTKATFRNDAEMEQVLGKPGENAFVRQARADDRHYEEIAAKIIARL
ncbi:MAG: DUF4954 family protein [Treponema sp.]|nr:DUF4954 family protein [Treponema sp.]